jgi:hypothetical protein
LTSACSTGHASKTVALASGQVVQIDQWGPKYFSSGESAIFLQYETPADLGDVSKLNSIEAEVWDWFRAQADSSGFEVAILSASKSEQSGVLTSSRSYNFIYKKTNGIWNLTNPAKAPPGN